VHYLWRILTAYLHPSPLALPVTNIFVWFYIYPYSVDIKGIKILHSYEWVFNETTMYNVSNLFNRKHIQKTDCDHWNLSSALSWRTWSRWCSRLQLSSSLSVIFVILLFPFGFLGIDWSKNISGKLGYAVEKPTVQRMW
jgi:hypothetical protein